MAMALKTAMAREKECAGGGINFGIIIIFK